MKLISLEVIISFLLYLFTFILVPSSLLLLPLPSINLFLHHPLYLFTNSTISPPTSPALYPWSLSTSSYTTPSIYLHSFYFHHLSSYFPCPLSLVFINLFLHHPLYLFTNSTISPPTSPALYPWSLSTSSYTTPSIYLHSFYFHHLSSYFPCPLSLVFINLFLHHPLYLFTNSTISPPTSPALYPWSLSTSSYTTPSIYLHSFYFHHLSSYFPCPLSLVFINLFLHHPLYLFTLILIPSSLLLLPLPSIPGLYQPLPTPPPLFIYIHSNSTIYPPTSPALYPWSLSTFSYTTPSIYLHSF